MAKPMPIDQPKVNGQATHPVEPGIVEEFVRILTHLSADKGCQRITSLVSEMDSLRARNGELESAMEESKVVEKRNFANIQEVMNDKNNVDRRCSQKDAEVEKAQRQASEAKEKLRLAQEEVMALKKELKSTNEGVEKAMTNGKRQELLIASLNGTIKNLEDSAKRAEKNWKDAQEVERAQAKMRYDAVNQELEALKKRAFPLQATSTSTLNDQGQLKGLFDDVCRLVYHFFGPLQLESLEAVQGKWQNLSEDSALTHIPLPRSNSEAARKMRVAAVLRLISTMACAYIFQPVYLTPDGMEVADIIYQLESRDAEWVRSVLLNIDRKEQGIYAKDRAEIAAAKVIELVGFLMNSTADTQKLRNAVCQWCEKAARLWMSLQQLRPTIEPQLEVRVDSQGLLGWRPFPELSLKEKHPTANAGAQNGSTSKPDDKVQLAMGDIAVGVWPRFLATMDDEDSHVLMSGYALLNAQTVTASEELKALAASLDRGGGSHRTTHGRQRQVRGIIGGANASTEKLSFLS